MSFGKKLIAVLVVVCLAAGVGLGVWFMSRSSSEETRDDTNGSQVAERPATGSRESVDKTSSNAVPGPEVRPVTEEDVRKAETYEVSTRRVTLPHVDLGRDVSDEKIAKAVGDAMSRESVPVFESAKVEVGSVKSEQVSDRKGQVELLTWSYVLSQGDAVVVVTVTCRDFEDLHDVLSVDFASYATEAPEVQEVRPYAGAGPEHGVHGVNVTAMPTPNGKWVVRFAGTLQGDWTSGADGLPTMSVNGHCVAATLDSVGDGYANVSYTVVTEIGDAINVEWAGAKGQAKVSLVTDEHIDLVANLGLSAKEAAQSAADGVANAVCSTKRAVEAIRASVDGDKV